MEYFVSKGDRLVCQLCAHYCQLKPGQRGICGVNRREGDHIENRVYEHPVALHVDPIEKKPLYHVLPGSKTFSLGTVGCNFRCPFCQNWSISQEHDVNVSVNYTPSEIVELARRNDCQSIAYTYNEPAIFYPYARDIATEAKKYGLKNLFVTNGFESTELIEDMRGIIDAANVDLKSFNEHYYKHDLGGDLQTVLENLKHFKRAGIWIEVTTLIIPTKNDTPEELHAIASFIAKELGCETPWHVSAFHPDYKERALPRTSFELLEMAYEIGKKAGLHYVYKGNIGSENPTRCSRCKNVLIERRNMGVQASHLQGDACPHCQKRLEGVFDV